MSSVDVKNAWGVQTPNPMQKSMQTIVDETLAAKLQAEEQQWINNETKVEIDQITPPPPAEEKVAFLDEDFALALKLQDEEQEWFDQQEKIRQQKQNLQNMVHQSVQTVSRNPGLVQSIPSMDYTDEYQYDDFEVHGNKTVGDQRRLPSRFRDVHKDNDGNYISKHDLELCGKKNAQELERSHHMIVGQHGVVNNKAFNSLKENLRRNGRVKGNGGRLEVPKRSTREGVLDEKTRLLLQKMTNCEQLDEIHGNIKTGKEANIYYGIGPNQFDEEDNCPRRRGKIEYAVKIFKTTLTEFRNRGEYVVGDHRFNPAFQKKKMRDQTNIWAEKEFANLHRVYRSGILSPRPLLVKDHILVMQFIGKGSYPAPQLREVEFLSTEQCYDSYFQIVESLRKLYFEAKLVHADLSEFNVLYYKKKCWLIDFGQAVTVTHPSADEFLKRDIKNINVFFQKRVIVLDTEIIDEVAFNGNDMAGRYGNSCSSTEENIEHISIDDTSIEKKINEKNIEELLVESANVSKSQNEEKPQLLESIYLNDSIFYQYVTTENIDEILDVLPITFKNKLKLEK